jgi:hypothetical protein
LAIALSCPVTADSADATAVSEVVSFAIQHRSIGLQRAKRIAVVNSEVRLTYAPGAAPAAYPDSVKVAEQILAFLQKYPDKDAYYEVIARALAASILDQYEAVQAVKVKLEIEPDEVRSYVRVATAEVTRAAPMPK